MTCPYRLLCERGALSSCVVFAFIFFGVGGTPASAAADPAESAAYYTFGRVIAKSFLLDELRLGDAQFEALLMGLRQVQSGQPPMPLDPEAERILDSIQQRIAALQNSVAPTRAAPPATEDLRRYLQSARAGLQLQETDSGLLFRIVGSGVGPRPREEDTVIVDIVAKAPDGETDLPQLSLQNSKIAVSSMLPGLAEGVRMLAFGGSLILVVPPHLSFNTGPWPAGLEPGMPLLLHVNLKGILPATR